MGNSSEPGKAADLTQWADDLVCPFCLAALHFSETTVVCSGCARTYPIVDGIPVLIPQRGTSAKSG